MRGEVTQVEFAALLAVAQDHAFGQPPGSQLRATMLGQELGAACGAERPELAATWWTSTLRFLGCTGHSFETAVVFGDEIELRGASLQADSADPMVMLRMMAARAGPGLTGAARWPAVLAAIAGGKKGAELNFRMACEVADAFAIRMDLGDDVRAALGTSFERWNGRGFPNGVKGDAIPRPMRVAQLAQELEALARAMGIGPALEVVASRRGKGYDPTLVAIIEARGEQWWQRLEEADPWDGALAVAPSGPPLGPDAIREHLLVLADFADLKSPWAGGHSRAVAALALEAAGPVAEAAALVHDLGVVAVPNTIWDKPGPLTRDERDRAETHTLVTEQLLRRLPFTSSLASVAASAHERLDGSGYHRHVTRGQLDEAQRVVAAADCYAAMTADRPHRDALAPDTAAAELRAMAANGRLDGEAVERVLAAAGHRRSARPPLPAGLTAREVEVLKLLALGLTNKQVAEQLVISPKTAGHHVQHIYTKIGVSTRGAAALFAIEHGVLAGDG